MEKQKTRVSSEMRRIITPLLIMAALVFSLNLGMSHRLKVEVVSLYQEQQVRSLRQSAQGIDRSCQKSTASAWACRSAPAWCGCRTSPT